ncbi:P-loop NTPase fold protein (plasmid) [Rhizobium sp. CC1099]|uniref:P-loop NTPase fold protein n=1 Tax=Rhizobium sp. CC1099 TaxID=3039160 RepID=UPI0024B10833|nr:P-loop NTPase fold protein [Rhizobium sp. CC1099]WFU91983.1 P-loop NTPase fold protein [Rhizobium sp. CC1099]
MPIAPRWSDLASDVAQLFGFSRPRSPALNRTIERGIRYVSIDERARRIVFDAKSLVVGLLAAGETERDSIRWGDTATWFYDWFVRQLSEGDYRTAIDAAKTDPDLIFPGYEEGFQVELSGDVQALISRAAEVSLFMNGRADFEARHFFAAMVGSGLLAKQLAELFGFYIANVEDDLKRNLIARLLTQPDTGETLEKWLTTFSLPESDKKLFAESTREADIGPVDPAVDDLLRQLEINDVTHTVRVVLAEAARMNQQPDGPAEVSSTRLFLSCLVVGRRRPVERRPFDLLTALVALSDDERFRGLGAIERTYRTTSSPPPQSIKATSNVLEILRTAGNSGWYNSRALGVDELLTALLLQSGTKIEERFLTGNISHDLLRTALVATLRPYDPQWNRWAKAFNLSPADLDSFGSPPPLTQSTDILFAEVGNDNPDKATLNDVLGAADEARAFARVATARGVSPPLAFGVFGEWGSGKSFFMRLMQEYVDKISRREATEAQNGGAFHENVVQIRFNAWHYVESNLWASLVDNIFVELDRWSRARQPADGGNFLLDELVTARELSLDAAERLVHQRQQQELAADRLLAAERELRLKKQQVGITPRALWNVVKENFAKEVGPEKIKKAADQLGLTELAENAEALKSTLDEVKTDAARARVLGRGLLNRLSSSWSIAALFCAIVAGPAVFAFGYDQLATCFSGISEYVNRWVASLVGLLSATTVVVKFLQHRVRTGLVVLESYRDKLEEAIDAQLKTPADAVAAAESDLVRLTSEVAEAKAALATSSDRLARAAKEYESDSGRDRLLRFVRDRAGKDGYSKHLGLIANIRKDFTQLSVLMAEVDARLRKDDDKQFEDYKLRVQALIADAGENYLTGDEKARLEALLLRSEPDPAQSFDRIILYIDDLDRCPPEQVVQVLQAVHLLLSFPLFVVVVAVDTRWVSRSLEAHYAGLLADHSTKHASASASDYLEKIFQIPYWVRPMTREASIALLSSLSAVPRPLSTAVQSSAPPASDPKTVPDRTALDAPNHVDLPEAGDPQKERESGEEFGQPSSRAGELPQPPGARALTLSDAERRYMSSIAPWVGNTPRRTLRFLNIYRVIKASLDAGNLVRLESGGYRALMAQLALIVGSKKGEGLTLLGELAEGGSIDEILKRSGDNEVSPVARGALQVFNDASQPVSSADWNFYREMAGRFGFENHRVSDARPTPQTQTVDSSSK